VHDKFVTGRRLRVLKIVDGVTRESMAAVSDTTIAGKWVVREPTELIAQRGKPTQNALVESLNKEMVDDLLNETLFMSIGHALDKIAAWAVDYRTFRPHSSPAYATPAAFVAELNKQWPASQGRAGSAAQAIAYPVLGRNKNAGTLIATG
jgi:putative transposase